MSQPTAGQLADRCRTLAMVADLARAEKADAERIATVASHVAIAEHVAAAKTAKERDRAAAERDQAHTDLADMLEVLARWGANIDEGNPAVVLEVALRDATRHGAVAARRHALEVAA